MKQQSSRHPRARPCSFLIAAATCAVLAACGGGGGDDDDDTDTSRVTREDLHQCPAEAMSPVDMTQLQCLVGRMEGTMDLTSSGASQTATESCAVEITADGAVTVTRGSLVHTHQLSAGAGTYTPWNSETGFSEYTGRADAGAPVASVQYEQFSWGTNSGVKHPSGSAVNDVDWKDLQIQYTGPSNGASNVDVRVVVSSANGAGEGSPRTICNVRL